MENHIRKQTRRLWGSVYWSTSITSLPSSKKRLKWVMHSSKLRFTMGRGGIVLASLLCSLVLNAAGIGFPSRCWFSMASVKRLIRVQGNFGSSEVSFLITGRSTASRKARRSSRRDSRAAQISRGKSSLRAQSSVMAFCNNSLMANIGMWPNKLLS